MLTIPPGGRALSLDQRRQLALEAVMHPLEVLAVFPLPSSGFALSAAERAISLDFKYLDLVTHLDVGGSSSRHRNSCHCGLRWRHP